MEERERKEEAIEDKRKVEDMVPKRFHRWLKVFGKQESERMPVCKTWDHAERCKRGFSCYKQKVRSSGSSPQSRAKGSEGRITERSDKND